MKEHELLIMLAMCYNTEVHGRERTKQSRNHEILIRFPFQQLKDKTLTLHSSGISDRKEGEEKIVEINRENLSS